MLHATYGIHGFSDIQLYYTVSTYSFESFDGNFSNIRRTKFFVVNSAYYFLSTLTEFSY